MKWIGFVITALTGGMAFNLFGWQGVAICASLIVGLSMQIRGELES